LNDPSELAVEFLAGAVTALAYYGAEPRLGATLILGHGAGAGQRSPFIVTFAQALATLGVDVVTFNFLYTEQRRRIPDRRPVLDACYVAVIERARNAVDSARDCLFIGGKSMGGRIATHVAAADENLPVAGLVLLGYPLHPPGRPDEKRDAHLKDVRRPMLIVQGRRDAFGAPDELDPVIIHLEPRPTLHVIEGGDHSFTVAKSGKVAQAAVYETVQRTIAEWIRDQVMRSARGTRRPRG
jgi:uncharacterized protein